MSSQKVAVVTGAGRGIGRALLEEFATRGYKVVAVVRTLSHVDELSSGNPNIVAVRCDVREPSTEVVLQDFLNQHVETVDVLVNNAGFGASKYGINGLDYTEMNDVLNVHCYGALRCVRATLPHLRKSSSASIINMSSRFGSLEWVANGVVPHDQATYPYRIAKAALNMATSCLAIELKAEGIRVLAIDPGKVKTRFGPKDADTEPSDAAKAVIELAENGSNTGLFVHASGEKLPW